MTKITLKGNEIHTNGDIPKIGDEAPDFVLVNEDLNNVTLEDYKNKNIRGSFYRSEIQLVDKSDNIWPIEKIVNTRKQRGQTEYLVKYLVYPSEANTWIPQTDLFDL